MTTERTDVTCLVKQPDTNSTCWRGGRTVSTRWVVQLLESADNNTEGAMTTEQLREIAERLLAVDVFPSIERTVEHLAEVARRTRQECREIAREHLGHDPLRCNCAEFIAAAIKEGM